MGFDKIQYELLARLRNEHLAYHFDTLRALTSNSDEFDTALDKVREVSEQIDSDSEHSPTLTEVMSEPSYVHLIGQLFSVDKNLAAIVQNLLIPVEKEERLARLKDDDLESYFESLEEITEEDLVVAIENGLVVNANDEFGNPLEIPSDEDVSGSFLTPPTPTAKIDAAMLRRVLHHFATKDSLIPDARGLRLRRVVIVGKLNLNWMTMAFPLAFQGCAFTNWISADHLEISALYFEDCYFDPIFHRLKSSGAINAAHLKVSGALRVWNSRDLRQLFIPDSMIGQFELRPPNASDEAVASFRTVMDGSQIGQLYFAPRDEAAGQYKLPENISITRAEGDIADIIDWLRGGQTRPSALNRTMRDMGAHERVWEATADALSRSGQKDDATKVRISYRRFVNQSRPPLIRLLNWLFADVTVRYFHRPTRALSLLAIVFAITWGTAFIFQDDLVQSPLANDTVPAGWLEEIVSSAAWSFMYALDSTFSPLSLGQIEVMWPSSVWLALALAILKGIGVVLLGLFIGSATTLVSKRTSD